MIFYPVCEGVRALLQSSLSDLLKKEKDNDPNVLLFDAAYYLLYICTKYWPKNKRSEDKFLCTFTGTPIDHPIIVAQIGYQYQISGNFFTQATSGALAVPDPDIANLRLTLSRRDRDYINAVGIQTNYVSKPVEPEVLTTEQIFKNIAIAGAIVGATLASTPFLLIIFIACGGSLGFYRDMVQLSPGLLHQNLSTNLFLHANTMSPLCFNDFNIIIICLGIMCAGAAAGALTFVGISGFFYLLYQGIYSLAYGTSQHQNQNVIFSLDPQFKQNLIVTERFLPSEKPQESKQDNQPPPPGKQTFFSAVASPLIRNSFVPADSAARRNLPPMVTPTSPRIGGR